jgi:GrpB-like predicted nucleotidyltransferase (UPF0157 family)
VSPESCSDADASDSREAPIRIVPYDPSWPDRFDEQREILEREISGYLIGPVEHVGSTAVPGLAAKAVIDIMAGVESLVASSPAIPILGRLRYCCFPYRADVMHWFCQPSPQFRTHHLHLVPLRSPLWNERIAFRDYLRRRPVVAAEYARLKEELAERYRDDREAYTEAKTPFVQRTLAEARREAKGAKD